MNESDDLKSLLQRWPYDPENDTRLIRGDDGRELVRRTAGRGAGLGVEGIEGLGCCDGLDADGGEAMGCAG